MSVLGAIFGVPSPLSSSTRRDRLIGAHLDDYCLRCSAPTGSTGTGESLWGVVASGLSGALDDRTSAVDSDSKHRGGSICSHASAPRGRGTVFRSWLLVIASHGLADRLRSTSGSGRVVFPCVLVLSRRSGQGGRASAVAPEQSRLRGESVRRAAPAGFLQERGGGCFAFPASGIGGISCRS